MSPTEMTAKMSQIKTKLQKIAHDSHRTGSIALMYFSGLKNMSDLSEIKLFAEKTEKEIQRSIKELDNSWEMMFALISMGSEANSLASCSSISKNEIKTKSPVESQSLKVLIIDDDAFYRGVIKRQLTKFISSGSVAWKSTNIIDVDSIDDATDHVSKSRFDLVICDVWLGSEEVEDIGDGLKFIEIIRGFQKNSVICSNSSHVSSDDRKIALAAGADFSFEKPLRDNELKVIFNFADKRQKKAE